MALLRSCSDCTIASLSAINNIGVVKSNIITKVLQASVCRAIRDYAL